MTIFYLALQDIKISLSQYRIWLHLGWTEVKQRYRCSIIGPWWITLSMLIFIFMMGLVFSRLFHQKLDDYIPFFTAGFLFWTFISSSITESVEIFRSNSGYIKQIRLPYSLYVFKHLTRQLIYLMHNFIVYVLVCVFFKKNPGILSLLVIPGLFLLVINVYMLKFLIAMICSRYRDMGPVINTCVQIAFFVTPISWMPKLLSQNSFILKLNPLTYLLDIVRSPLLGTVPTYISWLVSLGIAPIGGLLCFMIFSIMRPRIAFLVD